MLSEEDLEQVKMQIATDLAEVRAEYDSKIKNLHNLCRFWQALAMQALTAVTPVDHDRSRIYNLLALLKSPLGSHHVDEYEAEATVEAAESSVTMDGQASMSFTQINADDNPQTAQLRVDVDALIQDSNDLYARTKETEEFQTSLLRRMTNFNAVMTRLFCKMDYVHQGDIRELLGAILMDSDKPPSHDEVMAKVDAVLGKIEDLPEAPSGERARDELDVREERSIMIDA